MLKHMRFSLDHLVKATQFSLKGLKSAFVREEAFRQEIIMLAILAPLACWWGRNGVERALLIGSWMIVPALEMLNAAIEAVVDRISTEHHDLSGRAKDYGSAAVFIAICMSAAVWLIILWSHV